MYGLLEKKSIARFFVCFSFSLAFSLALLNNRLIGESTATRWRLSFFYPWPEFENALQEDCGMEKNSSTPRRGISLCGADPSRHNSNYEAKPNCTR